MPPFPIEKSSNKRQRRLSPISQASKPPQDGTKPSSSSIPDAIPTFQNLYSGYTLNNKSSTQSIPIVSSNNLDPKTFFEQYVAKRKPCVINHHPTKGGDKLNLSREILERVAGNELVQIEQRSNPNEAFGKRRLDGKTQIIMSFKTFLQKLTSEECGEMLYLSTQEDDEYEDDQEEKGKPTHWTAPCRQLLEGGVIQEDIGIAGNLILHACNLWIGRSPSGSSSGLHHDHHDNFYLLLRGTKRFRLYDPTCAPFMHLLGTVRKIHFNGRICYEDDIERGPDGIPIDLEGCKDGFDKDNRHHHHDSEDDDDDDEEVVFGKGHDYQSSNDDNDEPNGFHPNNEVDDYDAIMSEEQQHQHDSDGQFDNQELHLPPANNFSFIPPSLLQETKSLKQKYPDFVMQCKQCVVEVKAGQTLYLPTGWFHEVTSFSTQQKEEEEDGLNGCHMALNYWYHPPDRLDWFEFPYRSGFWRRGVRDDATR